MMTTVVEKYNHSEIIDWLENKFKGARIYKELEDSPEFQKDVREAKEEQEFFIYPRLAVNLILVEKKRELVDQDKIKEIKGEKQKIANYYTLFFVISSEKSIKENLDYLKGRLSFYQFYLSRISEPQRFKIIIVIPKYVDLPKECKKYCEDTGFGIWKVDIRDNTQEVICKPKTLREKMIEEFNRSADNPKDIGETVEKLSKKIKFKNMCLLKEAIKENAEDLAVFFEQYILDAVDAIAGVTPDHYGKRYIDRKLLYLMSDLKKVSYGERLLELVNEHLDENYDDYQYVNEIFSKLWEEHINIPYSTFLKTFEPALLHVYAEGERDKIYRDHYIHQFQVFLLGVYIIDKLYEKFTGKYKKPEIIWLIISSFHDMAYPVQKFDDWTDEFFDKVFKVKNIGHMDLKSEFIGKSFLIPLSYLITRLCSVLMKEKVKDNWPAEKNELVKCFYEEITEAKKHSILSSVSLLKIVLEKYRKKIAIEGMDFDEAFVQIFIPSALAIAIHDDDFWQKLKDKEQWRKKKGRCPLPILEFNIDPLSFLLIFCDNVQEWGRPTKTKTTEKEEKRRTAKLKTGEKGEEEEEKWRRFHLKDVRYDPLKGFDITIYTPHHKRTAQFFIDKETKLRELQAFLKQPSHTKFTIYLEDKHGRGEKVGFPMKGCA